MALFQKNGCRPSDRRIPCARVRELEHIRIEPGARRECRNESHGPAVNRRKTIACRRNTSLIEPRPECNDPGVRMSKDQNRLPASMTLQRFGYELSLPAACR